MARGTRQFWEYVLRMQVWYPSGLYIPTYDDWLATYNRHADQPDHGIDMSAITTADAIIIGDLLSQWTANAPDQERQTIIEGVFMDTAAPVRDKKGMIAHRLYVDLPGYEEREKARKEAGAKAEDEGTRLQKAYEENLKKQQEANKPVLEENKKAYDAARAAERERIDKSIVQSEKWLKDHEAALREAVANKWFENWSPEEQIYAAMLWRERHGVAGKSREEWNKWLWETLKKEKRGNWVSMRALIYPQGMPLPDPTIPNTGTFADQMYWYVFPTAGAAWDQYLTIDPTTLKGKDWASYQILSLRITNTLQKLLISDDPISDLISDAIDRIFRIIGDINIPPIVKYIVIGGVAITLVGGAAYTAVQVKHIVKD